MSFRPHLLSPACALHSGVLQVFRRLGWRGSLGMKDPGGAFPHSLTAPAPGAAPRPFLLLTPARPYHKEQMSRQAGRQCPSSPAQELPVPFQSPRSLHTPHTCVPHPTQGCRTSLPASPQLSSQESSLALTAGAFPSPPPRVQGFLYFKPGEWCRCLLAGSSGKNGVAAEGWVGNRLLCSGVDTSRAPVY